MRVRNKCRVPADEICLPAHLLNVFTEKKKNNPDGIVCCKLPKKKLRDGLPEGKMCLLVLPPGEGPSCIDEQDTLCSQSIKVGIEPRRQRDLTCFDGAHHAWPICPLPLDTDIISYGKKSRLENGLQTVGKVVGPVFVPSSVLEGSAGRLILLTVWVLPKNHNANLRRIYTMEGTPNV